MNFSAILFDETQHVVKTSMMGYVPICYEIINLFINSQNFLLIFLICMLKSFCLIVKVCDDLLMLSLDLFNSCLKPTWYDIFQDVLKCLTLVFLRFYNDINDLKDREEFIRLVLLILRPRSAPRAMGVVFMSFLLGISHLSRPPTDASLCLRPKNFPMWTCLNQSSSSLSTSTSMLLRLNSSDLLLPLETFNTEDIFIKFQAPARSC